MFTKTAQAFSVTVGNFKKNKITFYDSVKIRSDHPSFFKVQAPWLKILAPKVVTLKYNTPTLLGTWWQRTEICFNFLGRVRKISFAQSFKRGTKWVIYLESCKSQGQTRRQNLEYMQVGRRGEGVEDSFKTYKWDLGPSSGDSAIVLVLISVKEFKEVPPKNSGPAKKSCYYFWQSDQWQPSLFEHLQK